VSAREAEIMRFLAAAGWGTAQRAALGADWSNRRYARLTRGAETAILMDAAADAPVGRFVQVGRWLRGIGLHAPLVMAADEGGRLLLLEDLGDDLLAAVIARGGDERELYGLALEAILRFQAAEPPAWLEPLDAAGLVGLLDVYLDEVAAPVDDAARAAFRLAWTEALTTAQLGAPVFLYRDYHAENLLLLPGETGLARLGLLDFQDAFVGPAAYDVVSLIQDARRDVSPAVAAAVVDNYRAAQSGLGRAELERALAVLGAQRAARILGVIGRLARVKGREFPSTMRARVAGHLDAALRHPALAGVARWYRLHGAEAR
jgi:aminoglycoside/choline kinase family phosphotransferase